MILRTTTTIIISILFNTLLCAQALSPVLKWSEESERIRGISSKILSDDDGNVYVGGQLSIRNHASSSLFAIKYDSLGNKLWQNSYEKNGMGLLQHMELDAAGNLILMGTTSGHPVSKLIVIKFSPKGEKLWHFEHFEFFVIMLNKYGGFNAQPRDGFVDENGNIYVIGNESSIERKGQRRSLVIKLSPEGKMLWKIVGKPNTSAWSGSIYDDRIIVQGFNDQNLAYIHIAFDGTIIEENNTETQKELNSGFNFDKDVNNYRKAPIRQYGVTKVNREGNALWHYNLPVENPPDNKAYARTQALKVDTVGNVYITGSHYEEETGKGIVTTKLDKNGSVVWSHRYNRGGKVNVATSKTMFLTENHVFVGGISIADSLTLLDYQLLIYSIDGTFLAEVHHDYNGNLYESIEGITVHENDVYVTGYISEDGHYSNPMYLLTQRYHVDGLVAPKKTEKAVEEVKIFPNPFVQQIQIEQQANTNFLNKYAVHTVDGKLIKEGKLDSLVDGISLPVNLADEIYILTLTAENGQEIQKKVIKVSEN